MKYEISSERRSSWLDILTVALCMLGVYAVIYALTGKGLFEPATYNSYVLQAQRWLSGHLDLGQNYSHLEIATYAGKYFVSFPPIPSVILLPFCLLFGANTPDTLVAVAVGIIGAVYALKMAWLVGQKGSKAIFWALFVTVGSNFLHLGYSADVWYIAQVCSFTFTLMALYYAMEPRIKTGWMPLFFLALAFGCRPLQIVYLPLVAYLVYRKLRQSETSVWETLKAKWWWILPPLAVGVFLMALNYARFDNPFQFGHDYLYEFAVTEENGQFSLSYLAENWKLLWQLPEVRDGIVQFPLFNGCAFWIFSPIVLVFVVYFIKGIQRAVKSPAVLMSVVLVLFGFVATCCHATMGGWQFGNRYTVDALPVIYFALMVLLAEDKSDWKWLSAPLFLWGLGINLTGTIALVNQWLK